MPRFNEFYYLNGTYGFRTNLEFSADPIIATAVDYTTVAVSWFAPSGDYSDFRLVRSQRGFPQTQEDGVIISTLPSGASANDPYRDTTLNETAPLVVGRFVFYRAWVRKTENSSWVPAGDAYTLLPSPHTLSVGRDAVYTAGSVAPAVGKTTPTTAGDSLVFSDTKVNPFVSSTHERFLGLFPGVITSTTNTALDVTENKYNKDIDPGGQKDNSLFPTFMSAFSFTLDEMLTFANLVAPDVDSHYSSPTAVFLGAHQLGMTQDVDSVTATQRKLLRNAVELYSKKGTAPGLELYLQSATGYDTVLRDTVNLLLTHQDATFDLPFWEEEASAAISDGKDAPAIGDWRSLSSGLKLEVNRSSNLGSEYNSSSIFKSRRSLDSFYCLKITPSGSSQKIALGIFDPINYGIPVIAGSSYSLSFWAKLDASGSGTVSTAVTWFDKRGLKLSESTADSAKSIDISTPAVTTGLTTAFKQQHLSAVTAPSGAVYAGLTFTFSANAVYFLDRVQFQKTATIDTVVLSDTAGGGEYLCNNSFKTGDVVVTRSGSRFGVSVVSWATSTSLRLVESVTTATNPATEPIVAGSKVYLMDYEEPRGVIATLTPTQINRVSNPSLLTNANDWTGYNSSALSWQNASGRSGTGFLKAVSSGSYPLVCSPSLDLMGSGQLNCETGKYYSASCYVKDVNASSKYRIILRFLTSDETPKDIVEYSNSAVLLTQTALRLNSTTYNLSPHAIGPEYEVDSTNWTRVSHSVKVPPVSSLITFLTVSNNVATIELDDVVFSETVVIQGCKGALAKLNGAWQVASHSSNNKTFTFNVDCANVARTAQTGPVPIVKHHEKNIQASMYVVSVDTPTSGDYAFVDAAQFEDSSVPTDYYDGALTDDGNVWSNTDTDSASGKYPAREARLGRVREEIEDYLPYDTPYFIDLFNNGINAQYKNQISGIS